jgi:hypothetical protein
VTGGGCSVTESSVRNVILKDILEQIVCEEELAFLKPLLIIELFQFCAAAEL